MATLREKLRLANLEIDRLRGAKKALEQELDRQRIGMAKVMIGMCAIVPAIDVFNVAAKELGVIPKDGQVKEPTHAPA